MFWWIVSACMLTLVPLDASNLCSVCVLQVYCAAYAGTPLLSASCGYALQTAETKCENYWGFLKWKESKWLAVCACCSVCIWWKISVAGIAFRQQHCCFCACKFLKLISCGCILSFLLRKCSVINVNKVCKTWTYIMQSMSIIRSVHIYYMFILLSV